MPSGILPRQHLRKAERLGIITSVDGEAIPEENFQPASLDLRLGSRAYRIRTSFLPGDHTVEQRLPPFQLGEGIDLRGRSGGILEPGRPYLIPLMSRLKLPANVRAYANPKSSTGRVDVFTRVVTDKAHRFDEIPPGYEGGLWLEVFTRSFLVKIRMGMTLSQLRLIIDPDVDAEGVAKGGTRLAIPSSPPEVLRIHLRASPGEVEPGPVGFKAKRNNSTLLNLDRRNHDPRDFWEPIWPDGQLVLEPEEFYLLRSRELVAIPAELAAEMVPFEPTSGELRTHYAWLL